MTMPKRKFQAIAALTVAAALWGGAIPTIKYTLLSIPPFTFLFLRLLTACLIISPFLIREFKRGSYRWQDLKNLILVSTCGQTLHLSFVVLGLSRTTAYEGAILASVMPVFTVLGGVLILKEKINRLEAVGL